MEAQALTTNGDQHRSGPRPPRQRVRPRTHYEVLGVERSAGHDEIRQAYLAAARRWHPDRFGAGPESDAVEAEAAMRRVNAAWAVLGEEESRRVYDQQLVARSGRSDGSTSSGGTGGDPHIRHIDPRLLDPEFLSARRDAQLNEISDRSAMAVRAFPLLLVLALLVGIFVVSAYADRDGDVPTGSTVPGPSLGAGIEANDCVDVMSGPSLLEVPCTANADGRVIGAHLGDGSCPSTSIQELELSNGVWVCLGA